MIILTIIIDINAFNYSLNWIFISQLFLQTILSQHCMADNSSYNSSTQILQIPRCDVFPEKHPFVVVNIFCKSSEINHKPPLDNSEFFF